MAKIMTTLKAFYPSILLFCAKTAWKWWACLCISILCDFAAGKHRRGVWLPQTTFPFQSRNVICRSLLTAFSLEDSTEALFILTESTNIIPKVRLPRLMWPLSPVFVELSCFSNIHHLELCSNDSRYPIICVVDPFCLIRISASMPKA